MPAFIVLMALAVMAICVGSLLYRLRSKSWGNSTRMSILSCFIIFSASFLFFTKPWEMKYPEALKVWVRSWEIVEWSLSMKAM